MGLDLNAHSPTVAEQLVHSGYDWLPVDTQHGPGYEKLSTLLSAVASGGAKSMVRVGGDDDRPGIQQALDLGADGVLIPYINSAKNSDASGAEHEESANAIILARVRDEFLGCEFLEKGFTFRSIGSELHHVLTSCRRLRQRHGKYRQRKGHQAWKRRPEGHAHF